MTEAEALKRFLPILGRISTPGERATITHNILGRIAGQQTSIMAVSHKQAGALAWPSDRVKALAFESAMNAAVDAGEFVSIIHRVDRRHFQIEELSAWPDCPKVDIDSPLTFWLGDAFTEAPEQSPATPAPVGPAGAFLTGAQGGATSVLIQINGREAVPVRAIPFVTGWGSRYGISPDALARTLSRPQRERHVLDVLRITSAYSVESGKPVKIPPSEWHHVLDDLDALSTELKAQYPDDEHGNIDARGLKEWKVRSIEHLPPGVFIWLNSLKRDLLKRKTPLESRPAILAVNQFPKDWQEDYWEEDEQRCFDAQARAEGVKTLGDGELNLAPVLLTDKVRKMVREGFDSKNADTLARATTPIPAPVVTAGASGAIHSTKTPRTDSIGPVIELAQTKCIDPKNTNQVWPQMQVLADEEHPPFLASTKEGLKYRKHGNTVYFTRDALDKRLHPEKRGNPGKRR